MSLCIEMYLLTPILRFFMPTERPVLKFQEIQSFRSSICTLSNYKFLINKIPAQLLLTQPCHCHSNQSSRLKNPWQCTMISHPRKEKLC